MFQYLHRWLICSQSHHWSYPQWDNLMISYERALYYFTLNLRRTCFILEVVRAWITNFKERPLHTIECSEIEGHQGQVKWHQGHNLNGLNVIRPLEVVQFETASLLVSGTKCILLGRGDNLQLFISPHLKYEGWLYNIIDDRNFEINSLEPPCTGGLKIPHTPLGNEKILNFVLIVVNKCSNELKGTTWVILIGIAKVLGTLYGQILKTWPF